MEIKEFYSLNLPNLGKISKPEWRQFKFALKNGRFLKIQDQIRNEKQLQKWLVKKKPLDVYYSVARFLSPTTVGPRSEEISKNLFLGADLVFDLDQEPFCRKSIERARKQARKLVDFLKEKGIKINYIAFSGAKGFHVVCEDQFEYNEEKPTEREKKAKENRKEIVKEILENGIKIDSKVTVDTRRILRVPGTINSKTGLECMLLGEEGLEKRATEIVKRCKKVNISASEILKGNDRKLSVSRRIMGLNRMEVRSNPPYFYASFLSSQVSGTKLHVPMISFTTKNEEKAAEKLIELQKSYGLNDFYLFKGENLFAVGLNALQRKRIEKILKKAKSPNEHFFKKYKKAFVQVSPKVDEKMNEFEEAPKLIKTVESQVIGTQKPVSRSHLKFLDNCVIKTKNYENQVGRENYSLSHCLIEN